MYLLEKGAKDIETTVKGTARDKMLLEQHGFRVKSSAESSTPSFFQQLVSEQVRKSQVVYESSDDDTSKINEPLFEESEMGSYEKFKMYLGAVTSKLSRPSRIKGDLVSKKHLIFNSNDSVISKSRSVSKDFGIVSTRNAVKSKMLNELDTVFE